MKLKRLTPERLGIAREEYDKLINPVVKKLLGEYSTFEWVMYRVSEPTEFWKRDLPADTVRQKLQKAIFYALRDMMCESFVSFYGPTTGPTETSRVVQWAALEANHILHHPEDVDAESAAYEVETYPRHASSYLGEAGLKRIAEKLDFNGDPDSLAPALDELYPDPAEYDYEEEKNVDIEKDIDNDCLFFCSTLAEVEEISWRDNWEGVPHSSVGYLLFIDEEKNLARIAAIRPEIPLCTTFDRLCTFAHVPAEKEKDLTQDDSTVLTTLEQAIGKGFLVQIQYVDRDGEETERLIRPDKLEQKATGWYLNAYCTLREDQRTFCVNRIRKAVLTVIPAPHDNEELQDVQEQPQAEQATPEATQDVIAPRPPIRRTGETRITTFEDGNEKKNRVYERDNTNSDIAARIFTAIYIVISSAVLAILGFLFSRFFLD